MNQTIDIFVPRFRVRPLYSDGFEPVVAGYVIRDTEKGQDLGTFYVPDADTHARQHCDILNSLHFQGVR